MANWRKQQGESHHQVGHWRSSSYNRKPPLDNRQYSTMPSWEKEFCASVGSIPWRKLIETKKYMYLHDNVVKWDDSAVKEAFDNAKARFWAKMNGLPCDLPLPDPDMYAGNVDWDASLDPELDLDLEREAGVRSDEERGEEVVILGSSLLLNQSFSGAGWGPTGWGEDEEVTKPAEPNSAAQGWKSNLHENNGGPTGWGDDEEVTKPAEPNSIAQGWESNLHENNETNSWEQYCAPVEHAKEYEWQNGQNDSQGWNQRREDYGGDFQNKFKGRNGGNGNWEAWEGYNRKRENMTWSGKPGYHGNEFQMNRGRRNNRGGRGGGRRGRGGRRGNFGYDRSYVDKAPTGAW